MARMVGALGWHGQCSCCCGPDARTTVKAQEERQWRAEADEEMFQCLDDSDIETLSMLNTGRC